MSENIEVGSIVIGKVIKIKPFGAIVALPGNMQGLVHISHISKSFVQNITDHIDVGDTVKVKVLTIDTANNKISLSIKEAREPGDEPEKPQPPQGGFRDAPRNRTWEGPNQQPAQPATFEDKLKEWQKISNERHAGLNKRNKRR